MTRLLPLVSGNGDDIKWRMLRPSDFGRLREGLWWQKVQAEGKQTGGTSRAVTIGRIMAVNCRKRDSLLTGLPEISHNNVVAPIS
jgi:hypothetical protein